MSILTLKFFVFVALLVCTYYFCIAKYRWMVLLVASMGFFLTTSSPALLCVFIAMSTATWAAALGVRKTQSEGLKKAIAAVTIIALAAILIRYKEIIFFVGNFNRLMTLTGLPWRVEMPEWVAPLGISYFTLILIGYLLDVCWEKTSPEKNPFKFLLFAGYFPHMVSGPFSRYGDMKDSLFGREVKFSFKNLWFGFQRIVWGVFKVLVISTRVSVFVNVIYSAQELPVEQNHFRGVAVIAGAFLYILNVYMNFSGSMDIVIGVSELLGIPLAENFMRPFTATSLSEIWRKWHITLGSWVKDYIMYPVQKALTVRFGKSAKKRFGNKWGKNIILYTAMFIVWFCVGFWHGGLWKFIFGSGLFFFFMIVGGLILEPQFQKGKKFFRINNGSKWWRLFQQLRTALLFSCAISVGRAASLTAGLHMWKNLFAGFDTSLLSYATMRSVAINDMGLEAPIDAVYLVAITAISVAVVFAVSCVQERFGSVRVLMRKCLPLNIVIVLIILAVTVWFGGFDNSVDLIYGNF